MKKILTLLLLAYCASAAAEETPLLILNSINTNEALPARFRSTQEAACGALAAEPGLQELNMSGSGQFSQSGLATMLHKLGQPRFHVLDLRQESHGFANGNAVSWFTKCDWINKGKNQHEAEADEHERLEELKKQHLITFYQISSSPIDGSAERHVSLQLILSGAYSEKELCEKANIAYTRITTPDHTRPTPEAVDLFTAFVARLQKGDWVHFHCEGGAGRTTTFMAMFDMIHNAKSISFESIIARQHQLGGIDLTEMPPTDDWRYPHEKERLEFLKEFYNSCKRAYFSK